MSACHEPTQMNRQQNRPQATVVEPELLPFVQVTLPWGKVPSGRLTEPLTVTVLAVVENPSDGTLIEMGGPTLSASDSSPPPQPAASTKSPARAATITAPTAARRRPGRSADRITSLFLPAKEKCYHSRTLLRHHPAM